MAPWLSMLSRSVLAAAIFSIGIPGVLTVVADIAGAAIYGLDSAAEIDRFADEALLRGMIAICAIGAVAGWHTFMRLEAIEGAGAHVHLPAWPAASRASDRDGTRRPAVWLLVKKELRLQQMTFVIVAFYLVVWTAAVAARHWSHAFEDFPIGALSMLYFGILSIVIGSMAAPKSASSEYRSGSSSCRCRLVCNGSSKRRSHSV